MAYQPIENYGIIGNMRTAALVGQNGSIDWLCWPYFDSPSVFAALLDERRGGAFQIAPADQKLVYKQHYWPDTNLLVSRFLCPDGVGEVQDFMPVSHDRQRRRRNCLVRRVHVSRGQMEFRLRCEPAFDYARVSHKTELTDRGAEFESSHLRLRLSSSRPLTCTERGVETSFRLKEGETCTFVLEPLMAADDESDRPPVRPEDGERLFHETVHYWRQWLGQCTYAGRWRDEVHRSALTLKLLTFEPSGAILAAASCSLPEHVGGARNWDYRYAWLRDAAFSVYSLLRVGFTSEAHHFMQWIDARYHEQHALEMPLQIVYGIDGRHNLHEQELTHLSGYRDSSPVRIGNAAFEQMQLDVFGELFDAVYLYNKYAQPISYDAWGRLRDALEWLCDNWRREDQGIWEVRGPAKHFVFSKVMCWVAMDRGLRLASKRSLPCDENRWRGVRNTIYEEVMRCGWNAEKQSFVESYGSDRLDASLLVMPLVLFMAPNDPQMLSTIRAINRSHWHGGLVSDGMVHRYEPSPEVEGLTGHEGTFSICTFWLIEALTRAGVHRPELLENARLIFERILSYANHLGLYSEQIGLSGELLGNYPQALTHIGLISAAFNLDRAYQRHGEC